MSLLIQAQTSTDDEEIMECINLVLSSCKLGLVHESVDVNYVVSYTSKSARQCFALSSANILAQGVGLPVRSPFVSPLGPLLQQEAWLTSVVGANGVFAETILDIAKRKPHLIFTEANSYEP